jgi:hypothetical protein
MRKTIWAFVTGSWIAVFEGLAVLTGLAILGAAALFWRLSLGPIDIGFLKPYVEEALSDPARDLSVRIGRAVLEWEGAGKPLLVGLQDFRVLQGQSRTLFSVDRAAASLSLPMLAIGRIEPRTVMLDGPSLRVVRSPSDVLQFGSQDWSVSVSEPAGPALPSAAPAQDAGGLAAWAWDLTNPREKERAALPSFLQKLRSIELRGIRLMVEDHVNGVSWFLPQSDFTYTNARGAVRIAVGLGPQGPAARGTIDLEVRRAAQARGFDILFSAWEVSPALFADRFGPLEALGRQTMTVDIGASGLVSRDLALKTARVVLNAGASTIHLPEAYTHPVTFESFRAEAFYDAANGSVDLTQARLKAGAVDITAKARAVEENGVWALQAEASIPQIATQALQMMYPDNIPHDNSREWVIHRISGGGFKDASAHLSARVDPKTRALALERLETAFSFDGIDVHYREPLMPIEDARGSGTLDIVKNTLVFKGESAAIRDMKARNIAVTFNEIMTAGKGVADIAFDLTGPLATGLRYVSSEPISLGDDLGLDPDRVEGTVDFRVTIGFPTIRNLLAEQVKVKVKGSMTDLTLPAVVKGLPLTGGPLSLETTDGSFRVSGKAALADRPVTLDWTQYLSAKGAPFSSRVTASLGADKGLRDHFGVDVDDFVSGTVPVVVTYTEFGGGRSQADVRADLGPVRATIRPFAYDKPPGAPGTVTLQAFLQNASLKDIKSFSAKGPDLSLTGGTLSFENGQLRRAEFPSFRVGETDVALSLSSAGPNAPLKVAMTGPFLDARPFLNPKTGTGGEEGRASAPYDGPALSASVNAARLRTKDARIIDDARVAVDMNRAGDLTRIDARARIGAGDFFMRLAPDVGGVPSLRIDAQDAGSTLRAFNIYENLKGGRLTALGKPSGKGRQRDITGTVTLEQFKVVNAPVLAQLVSALSLPGLLQLLGNEGLGFSRAQAQFEWKIRPTGTSYVFREGRTSGNSLGLTFDGVVDKALNTLDISGTIVPVSEVNSLLSNIPLVGDILTGGADGGILAATYSVKGNADRPRVMVNPLAALAPGILRRIFFEGEKPSEKQARKERRSEDPSKSPSGTNK